MPLIDQPWTRVRNPVPIPDDLDSAVLAGLSDVEFAELIRSNLTPANPAKRSPEYLAWNRLWERLRAHDDLADRAYDVLEEFEEQTEEALEEGKLDDAGRKRAEKFLLSCNRSWQRIDREPPVGPLGWAGKAGNFPPHAAKVIAQLVSAIASHRTAVRFAPRSADPEDEMLWQILRHVDLDPDDYA